MFQATLQTCVVPSRPGGAAWEGCGSLGVWALAGPGRSGSVRGEVDQFGILGERGTWPLWNFCVWGCK